MQWGNALVVRIDPSEMERSARAFGRSTIEKASQCLRTDGVLILEDIVDVALVREARQTFIERYARYLTDQEHDDALKVGEKRVMVTVELKPPFDSSELFASPWLLPVLNAVLEENFVLGGYGVVCSLPSASNQHCHRDGGILFPNSGIDLLLPAAAVTVAIPLLEMNDIHGTTAVWLGSHRDAPLAADAAVDRGEAPVVREGSCILWDYRVWHGGTANRSTVPRPLLYLMYCRPWFLDHQNYHKQRPLLASRIWLSKLSPENQRLLDRATAC
jgi:Phytanoyl-CoA dioxygenase (PhyH)